MKEYHLFYAPDFPLSAALPSDDSNHAVRVLRMKEGDELRVTDGVGNFYDCTITMASRSNCLLQVDREHRDTKSWKGQIHLVVAPTKNMDRMEWLAEKATEIGIDRISFIDCKNSERRVVKTERIERIVISAMKQSHKAWKPLVDEMCPFVQFLKQPFSGQRFIAHCYDMDDGDSMNDAAFMQSEARHTVFLPQAIDPDKDVQILIGPEGDFAPEEVGMAFKAGFKPISLGKSRLRTETAALVAVHLANVAKMQ